MFYDSRVSFERVLDLTAATKVRSLNDPTTVHRVNVGKEWESSLWRIG